MKIASYNHYTKYKLTAQFTVNYLTVKFTLNKRKIEF